MTSLVEPTFRSPSVSAGSFVLAPIAAEFVQRVRATLRDDFGRTVALTVAQGGEPMRDQLRRANPGERLILCSYQAVPLPSVFAEIGPVFISADAAAPAPCAHELPPGYFNRTFAVRAYDAADRIVDSCLVEPAAAPERFRELLARPDVACLHARFAGHGCFAARIDRAPEGAPGSAREQPFADGI